MGIKNSVKACNTKCAISCNTKKEPTHISTIARKRLANSVFICIDFNIIRTPPSCLQHLKILEKNTSAVPRFFISVFKSCKHLGLGLYYIHVHIMLCL